MERRKPGAAVQNLEVHPSELHRHVLTPNLIFLSLEKYIVRGLTFGAVKG